MPSRVSGEHEPVGTETLYAVIGAVAAGPDLDRVLPAVVDLLVDATGCHACFIYLREGNLLRIRAASPIFAHVVDRVALHIEEGITGWVARNRQPALVREAALQDPRMKYVPELEEEHFQSLAAVPLIDRRGDVTGVVMLHTQAPREFGQDVVDLLVHVASLVVGAIDNARLYEQTQQQVATLSALSDLSRELAALTSRDQLYEAGCRGIARLVNADRCTLSLYDDDGVAVEVARYADDTSQELPSAFIHAPGGGRLSIHLLDAGRAFGVLHLARRHPFTRDHEGLLQTAANQLALALRTAKMIEQLAAETAVRRLFEALEEGRLELTVPGREAGWRPDAPHVAVVAAPIGSWDGELSTRVEHRMRLVAPGALFDMKPDGMRALLPLPRSTDPEVVDAPRLRDQLDTVGADLGIRFGISRARSTLGDGAALLSEAEDALRLSSALGDRGGAREYDELGPYRFLVPLIEARPPDPRHARALDILSAYDARRGATLLETLEMCLRFRGRISAAAESLLIHPNTLRQRLERIETLTKLCPDEEDPLSLELSIKVHRLQKNDRGDREPRAGVARELLT